MSAKLAIDGGPKAAGNLGPFPTKIGKDELLEVLDLWQFSGGNMEKIKAIIGEEHASSRGRETDASIAEFVREYAETIYHPVGTCKMGNDKMSVVDDQLRVKGLKGLRVVDASVMPTLVGGNTNAPVIMIAEKASDMILEAVGQ